VILIADMFIARLRDQLAVQGLGLELSAAAQGFLAEKVTTPNSRSSASSRRAGSTSRTHSARRSCQGVPRRSDDRRRHRRRSRRTVLDLRGRRGSAAVGGLRRPLRQRLRSQPTRSLIEVKSHSVHVCRECGTTSPRWSGRCSGCGEWNTLDEERTGSRSHVAATMSTTSLRDVAATTTSVHSTGVGELDRVVGGGFIAGSTTLLFGERRRQVDARSHVPSRVGGGRYAGAADRGRGVSGASGPTGAPPR